jgi:serine/threonine-protein phosphatase 6 catalytic subunit
MQRSVGDWIEALLHSTSPIELIPESDFRCICKRVKKILKYENSVPIVPLPAVVAGDIHGQFYDLLEILRIVGNVNGTNLVFLGDYVDRGYNSIETFTLLMLLKLQYPERVTLLRGNHESRQVSQVYGFYDEIVRKYGNASVWRDCVEVFDYLPISAVIGGKVFAVHGGLSPDISHIDQIRQIDRIAELPTEGEFADLMWSDPEESIADWSINPRGAGWVFGAAPTRQFLHINGMSLVARAHQLVQEGFKYNFTDDPGVDEGMLVTVWSAPNYCYRCGNVASIMTISEDGKREFTIFNETEKSNKLSIPIRSTVPYFV